MWVCVESETRGTHRQTNLRTHSRSKTMTRLLISTTGQGSVSESEPKGTHRQANLRTHPRSKTLTRLVISTKGQGTVRDTGRLCCHVVGACMTARCEDAHTAEGKMGVRWLSG